MINDMLNDLKMYVGIGLLVYVPLASGSFAANELNEVFKKKCVYPEIRQEYSWLINESDSLKNVYADQYVFSAKNNPCVPDNLVNSMRNDFLKALE